MNVARSPPQRGPLPAFWLGFPQPRHVPGGLHSTPSTEPSSSLRQLGQQGLPRGGKSKTKGGGWGAPGFLSQVEGTLTGLLLFLKPAGATPHPKPCHHQHCPVSAEGTRPLEPRGCSDNLLGGLWLRASY